MLKDKIQYGESTIDYDLSYSERKTLGIRVHPNKRVEVLAPNDTDISIVKEKLRTKAPWILRQQDFFLSFHPLTPARKYVSGETHLYLGKQYRLKVLEAEKESVKLNGGRLVVSVKDKENKKKIERLLRAWYKSKAEFHFRNLFEENKKIASSMYNGVPRLKSRWMEKRWGSCDRNGTIHLNLELIKAPKACIEYVIIHEMCHLSHLNHSSAFFELLGKYCPNWMDIKDQLEKLMV